MKGNNPSGDTDSLRKKQLEIYDAPHFHYKYMSTFWQFLRLIEGQYYPKYGRGAIEVNAINFSEKPPPFRYMPESAITTEKELLKAIRHYNPENEFVFSVILTNNVDRLVYIANEYELERQNAVYLPNFPFYKEYPQLLDFVFTVINESLPDVISKYGEIHYLATKLYFNGMSIHKLLDGVDALLKNPITSGWTHDVAAINMICRSAYETYLALFEIFVEHQPNAAEFKYRYLLWFLKDYVTWEKFATAKHIPAIFQQDFNQTVATAKEAIQEIENELQSNDYFKNLPSPTKKSILGSGNGKRYFGKERSRQETAKIAGLGDGYVEAMYSQFSGYTHANGLAVKHAATIEANENKHNFDWVMWIISALLSNLVLIYVDRFPAAKNLSDQNPALFEIVNKIVAEVQQAKM